MPTKLRQLPLQPGQPFIFPERYAHVRQISTNAARCQAAGDLAGYAACVAIANAEFTKLERGFFRGFVDAYLAGAP